MARLTYAMSDDKTKKLNFPKLIDPNKADYWNFEKGFAIFQTVNQFINNKRSKDTLLSLDYCFVDIDSDEKKVQLEQIKRGFIPSSLVESKNGYHLYLKLSELGDILTYQKIQRALCQFYKADPKAIDASRILRKPGYYHYKIPSDPYLVREVLKSDFTYSVSDLLYFYSLPDLSLTPEISTKKTEYITPNFLFNGQNYSIWNSVWNLNCKSALEALSGTQFVNFEVYNFRRLSNGNYNIFSNGQSTSCWIDKSNRIGSMSKGGPTIYHWLRWFGHSKEKSILIIKEVYGL